MNMELFSWSSRDNTGAFQKLTGTGRVWSDLLTTKPSLGFEYLDLDYIPGIGKFLVDEVPMTDQQKAACAEWLASRSYTIQQAKEWQKADIRVAAKVGIESGVVSNVLGADHTYPTTAVDQQNLAGLAQQANIDGIGAKFWCADASGNWARRDHTAAQLIQLGREVIAHVQAQQNKYESLLAQIDAATTIEDVEAISW